MNTINERIELIMRYYEMNINTFSRRIGMKNNSIIGKIVNNHKRKPNYSTLIKIIEAFPKVCCMWLMTGKGEMFGGDTDNFPDLQDRITHIMKKHGISLKEFAVKISVPASEIQDVVSKSKEAGPKLLPSILSAFPEIEPRWLFMNEGGMMRDHPLEEK
jgi:predicted transcriptional regulator